MGKLVELAGKLERQGEFTNSKELTEYAATMRKLSFELYLRLSMEADGLQEVLKNYRSRWYPTTPRQRVLARLVASHLRVSAEAARAMGVGTIKMHAAFRRHFLIPEAQARGKKSSSRRSNFEIDPDEY